ncbi:MAG: NAD(P)H-quinone oxidoreductase subunit I, partial [Cyanobacteria bacterium J06643_5]
RELVYLPEGVMEPHDLPEDAPRAGSFPQDLVEEKEEEKEDAKG